MKHKQNAFTLIEFLLVIITIMMLSSILILAGEESQAASKATKILNDLTNLKIFVLTWYKDNQDKIDSDGNFNGYDLKTYFESSNGQEELEKFFVNNVNVNYSDGSYGILNEKNNDGNGALYICFYLEKNIRTKKIKAKLASKAAINSSLLQRDGQKWKVYIDGQEIYMQVLAFNY